MVGSGQSAESALNDAAEALRLALAGSDGAMDLVPEMRELGAKAVAERERAEDLADQVDDRNGRLQGEKCVSVCVNVDAPDVDVCVCVCGCM